MKIKEVSEQYDITPDTLRYYERIGLIRNVPRDKNGIRNYSEESCNTIAFIKCMRSGNVSIEGLTEYIELYNQGSRETYEARKAILVRERDHDIAGEVVPLLADRHRGGGRQGGVDVPPAPFDLRPAPMRPGEDGVDVVVHPLARHPAELGAELGNRDLLTLLPHRSSHQ